jgi:hypothetical protein
MFKVPERPSKLDPFAEAVGVAADRGQKEPQAEAHLKQLHADLMSLGYNGSYGRVAAFAREWKADRQREMQHPRAWDVRAAGVRAG